MRFLEEGRREKRRAGEYISLEEISMVSLVNEEAEGLMGKEKLLQRRTKEGLGGELGVKYSYQGSRLLSK